MKFEHEEEIVWLDDRSKYPYLREVQLPISGRTRRPRSSIVAGKLIAYATLEPTAPAHSPGMFVRRLFYVTRRDPYDRGGPYEAVDPYSVHPGIPAFRGEEIITEWVTWQRAARVLQVGNRTLSQAMLLNGQ